MSDGPPTHGAALEGLSEPRTPGALTDLPAGPRSFAVALRQRDNALNFLRLVLASLVIVQHTAAFVFPDAVVATLPRVGDWAVGGFFAVSGYLIAASRSRSRFGDFLWARALRILPAYWAVLLVTAFAFAPLSVALGAGGQWEIGAALRHVGVNVALWQVEPALGSTLANSHWNGWNASLWTLAYEFAAYLAVGTLWFVRAFRRARVQAVLLAVVTIGHLVLHEVLGKPNHHYAVRLLWLSGFFLAGCLVWTLGDRIRPHLVATLGCGVLFGILAMTGTVMSFGYLPLAYLVLSLATQLPVRIGSVNDVSYGVYIYGFPVQQVLWAAGGASLGYWGFIAVSLLASAPLAWASWVLVERPALRWKSLWRSRREGLS